MITCPADKLQKVLLSGGCEQNGTPTPDNPIDIVCNNGVLKVSPNLVEFNETRINSSTWASADKTKGFEVNADVYNKSVGSALFSNNKAFGAFVPCKLGQSVSINFFDYNFTGSRCFYCEVTADGECNTTPVQYATNAGALTQSTFTLTQSDSIGFVFEWYLSSNETRNYTKENYMIVSGTTQPTAYMPYGQIYTDGIQEVVTDNLGNTANAEMLLAVDDYKDTQEVLSGSVTRNVGIKVFDGTENWNPSIIASIYRYRTLLSGTRAVSNRSPVISTHFKDISSVTTQVIGGAFTSGQNLFIIPEQSIDTVDKLKVWLANQYANGTPVIIVYLATPTTEQVTPQPLAGSSATVTAGSIDNLPIESSTIAELKKRYIGDKEVQRVYIGDNLVYNRND